jgi:YaaC-like Protein
VTRKLNQEIWQQLLSLESRDITQQWFERIHSRQLNVRRAKEINAAAKQAREFFRNANNSNYSVRPLLTFYGVACLSRSLLLLLKASGGEEGLTASHGIETVGWGNVLSGDTAEGLNQLGNLKIRTRAGLFSDFVKHTNNRISIHVRSGGVDWRLSYDIPESSEEFSIYDLFSRIPDLQKDYVNVSNVVRYAFINEMTYSNDEGFRAKITEEAFSRFQCVYEGFGYTVTSESGLCILTCDAETFANELPMFIHTYVHKMFGSIPSLYITEPFSGGARYSQLCITYMVSFILGMLVRYYPTHWMSLIQGDKGDTMWPTINRAQQFVEHSYPELVIELISDILETGI